MLRMQSNKHPYLPFSVAAMPFDLPITSSSPLTAAAVLRA